MYRVAGVVYRTKRQLQEALSHVLRSHKQGDTLAGAELDLLNAVLKAHPRAAAKIGPGVKRVYIGEGKIPGEPCFWIERTDGTKTDFSFMKCLNPPSHWTEVQKAARTEIRDQIAAFREKAFTQPKIACAITGKTITKDDCHIDHVYRFELILADFLHAMGLGPEKIEISGHQDASTDLMFVDRNLAMRWAKYHQVHAHLRAVAPKANLTRKRG